MSEDVFEVPKFGRIDRMKLISAVQRVAEEGETTVTTLADVLEEARSTLPGMMPA